MLDIINIINFYINYAFLVLVCLSILWYIIVNRNIVYRIQNKIRGASNMRKEHDFLGELEVPDEVYYGVQTLRAIENFAITGHKLDDDFITAMAQVKKATFLGNMSTGRMDKKIGNALVQAADEVIQGKMHDQFPVDPIQGGAGTSCNMNMNEVLCNRALEILGEARGCYDIVSPNNHANMAQSTNTITHHGTPSAIENPDSAVLSAEAVDVLGRPVGEDYKGVVIIAGKKILR